MAVLGASGTYGRGILARAEELGVETVVVTLSPHKFKDVKPRTTVVEAQVHEEDKLKKACAGCGRDRVCRHGHRADDDAGGEAWAFSASPTPSGERSEALRCRLARTKRVGARQSPGQERDAGMTRVLTRSVRPTKTPFVGAYLYKDQRGPLNDSIYDHRDFCLYCVASSEWDHLAPHVSSGPQPES